MLHQILFLFTSRFIIDTGSPWATIGPSAPPLLYHFDQETAVNDNNYVIRGKIGRDMGFGYFSKLPQRKSNLDNISSSNLRRIIFLVSPFVFSWSKN